jgi:uncharacterized short protein YbdD (DUF466 family)
MLLKWHPFSSLNKHEMHPNMGVESFDNYVNYFRSLLHILWTYL